MFYFQRKKHSSSIFTVFVCRYLPTAMFICFWKGIYSCLKYSVLDVAGVLSPSQYALTWIAYRNNLIQAADKR